MSKVDSVNSGRSNSRVLLLTIAALALAIALPLLIKVATNSTQAQTNGPGLVATLTGAPIAGQTPHGSAAYYPASGNFSAHLFVEVGNVNLPANTHLSVFLNTTSIGMITLDSFHHGEFFSSSPPAVVAGDTLAVMNGTTTILSGTFAAAPTPTPFPTHSPFPTQSPRGTPNHSPFPTPSPRGTPVPPVHLFAPLTGDPIDGVVPRGIGLYQSFGGEIIAVLDVYVSFVNLPEGTELGVAVAGSNAGSITLHNHMGFLHLGENVPVVMNGDSLTVTNGETTILSGVFSNNPPPFPTPTPHGSPTPHGTPGPAHVFGANLNGEQEVPPVTTDGHGHGFILLNRDETEIRVFVGFAHLSGAPTAVTINGPAMPGANGPVIFTLTLPPPPPHNTLPFQTFDVTAEQVTQLRANLWYFNVATEANPDGEIRGQIMSRNHRDDFDGDGLSEVSVMRPGGGSNTWYMLNSSDNSVSTAQIGGAGDINVQGDYDGDGTADIAMFTPSTGTWQIRLSETGQTMNYHWGANGDIPLVGDYDGDGISDLVVFRPSNGNWYVRRSIDGVMQAVHWGQSGDRPVSGDFDGDGSNDLAVFRPSTGNWYVLRSSDNGMTAMRWGMSGDRPVAGDFDGDGRTDLAVFRPSDGNWYVSRSSDNGFTATHFGMSGDVPVPCEFDGDGNTDIAVFRPSNGNWYILRSSDDTLSAFHFGISTDHPITTAYAPQ